MDLLRNCANCGHAPSQHGDRAVAACMIERSVKGGYPARQQRCNCPGYREAPRADR